MLKLACRNLYIRCFLERVLRRETPKCSFYIYLINFLKKCVEISYCTCNLQYTFCGLEIQFQTVLKLNCLVMAKPAKQSNLLMVRKCRTCHKIQFSFLFLLLFKCFDCIYIQLCQSIEITSSKSILMFFLKVLKSSSF